MNHLEIEFKTMLTQAEHRALLPYFEGLEPVRQTNYYLDTADFSLRQARVALRIRTFSDRAELTLKIPQQVGNYEYNLQLSQAEYQAILDQTAFPDGEIKEILQSKGIAPQAIRSLGSLTTIRHEKHTPIGLMALDESHYLGKTDYELELEVQDADQGQADFQAFLAQEQLEYKPGKSKIARFAENL